MAVRFRSSADSILNIKHISYRPIVSTLVGLLLSNTGVIPCESPVVYGLVNKYLLPLAVPLLLFTADLRQDFTLMATSGQQITCRKWVGALLIRQ